MAVDTQVAENNRIEILRSPAIERARRREHIMLVLLISGLLALMEAGNIFAFIVKHETFQLYLAISYAVIWAITLYILDNRRIKERSTILALEPGGVVDILGDLHPWSEFTTASVDRSHNLHEIRLHRPKKAGFVSLQFDPVANDESQLISFAERRIHDARGLASS